MVFQFVFKLVATILSFDRVSALTAQTNRTDARNTTSLFSNASPKPTTLDENDAFLIAIKVLVIVIPLLPIIHYGFYCLYQKLRGKELTYKFYNNVFSFHAWIGVIIWSVYIILYVKFKWDEHSEKVLDGTFAAAIIFLTFGYIHVIIGSFRSSIMNYLNTDSHVDNCETYIRSVIAQCPKIKTKAKAFHFETHYCGDDSYDKYIKTWSGSEIFESPWADMSNVQAIPKILQGEILRIKLYKKISFANEDTKRVFKMQRHDFIAYHKNRDERFRHRTSYEIDQFKEHVMAYDSEKRLPFWMNRKCFIICTFLGLSWPFRWLFKCYTTKKYFTVKKEFSTIRSMETVVNTNPKKAVNLPLPLSYSDAMQNAAYQLPTITRPYMTEGSRKI